MQYRILPNSKRLYAEANDRRNVLSYRVPPAALCEILEVLSWLDLQAMQVLTLNPAAQSRSGDGNELGSCCTQIKNLGYCFERQSPSQRFFHAS